MACFAGHLKFGLDYPEALNNLGSAFQAQGRLEEAGAAYRQALHLRPNFLEAQENLGDALQRQGLLNEAVAAYRSALEVEPDYPGVGCNVRHRNFARLGQFDEAFAAYESALKLKPDNEEAFNNFGNALRDKGRLVEAIDAYRQALQLRPDLPEIHTNLGNAPQRRWGSLDKAIASFHRAIELGPDDADAHNSSGPTRLSEPRLSGGSLARFRRALGANRKMPASTANWFACFISSPVRIAETIGEDQDPALEPAIL